MVTPNSSMCVKSDAPSRPGGCFCAKNTSLAGPSVGGVVELNATMISDGFGWCLLVISVVVFSWLIFFGDLSAVERKRCAAILVLFVSSALFWAAYEQAGSSLSFFAERGTDCTIFGYAFPASWFQSVQPVFVVVL